MPRYQIACHQSTKAVVIQPYGDVLPANIESEAFVNIGNFYHENVLDALGDDNHVMFHHIRDALYKRSAEDITDTAMFPFNITDISGYTIALDEVKNNVSISVTPATATLTVASPTVQLATAFTPSDSTNQSLTYSSSDETKATVSASGLVTRVANGAATITITTVEGGKTDTVAITCTA